MNPCQCKAALDRIEKLEKKVNAIAKLLSLQECGRCEGTGLADPFDEPCMECDLAGFTTRKR